MNGLHVTGFIDPLEQRLCLSNGSPFAAVIDNPFLPMIPGTTYIYRGVDDEGNTVRQRVVVTDLTKQIMGVACTVVRDRVYTNGELTEDTRDFFAQDKAGNVWYFGEDTRELDNGVVVSTEGSFEAGVNGAKAGIIMKAHPAVGDAFAEENAPGVAEDKEKVLSLHERAKVPFGTFGDCVQVEETTPLEPGLTEHKFYAPGIGLVRDETVRGGSASVRLAYLQLAPEAFSDTIDNPFLPMIPGTTFIYRGVDDDGNPEQDRITIAHDTKVITGVTTTIVRDRVFVNSELIEDTLDFFAQDKVGNVWYFGEDTKEFDNGVVVSTEGSFEAGVNGAKAGIIMKAFPGVGDSNFQEDAPGVAEDQAKVLSLHERVKVPFGTFGDCTKTEEFTALEPTALEHKFYAPGIGFVMSQAVRGGSEVLRLVAIVF